METRNPPAHVSFAEASCYSYIVVACDIPMLKACIPWYWLNLKFTAQIHIPMFLHLPNLSLPELVKGNLQETPVLDGKETMKFMQTVS